MKPLHLTAKLGQWTRYLLGMLILLGFLAGWLLAISAAIELNKINSARGWPTRQAEITHSYARQLRSFQSRAYWHAEIAGKYVDDGRTFGVSRHAYGIENSINTRGAAEIVVKKYPVGMRLAVYPEPGNPRRAILDPRAPTTLTWVTLLGGIGLIVLPFALHIYGRLRARKQRSGSVTAA